MEQMGVLKNTRPDLLLEGSLRKRESIMMRHLLLWLDTLSSSIRSIIAIASTMGWKLHQMDVKTAFLNGIIEE